MSLQVCMGAQIKCSFGAAPAELMVLPLNRVLTSNMPAANITDHIPLVNILPFGTCSSLANPSVAAATAAAFGVLTPMPCVPVTATPWTPGDPTVMIGNQPCVANTSTCLCAWGGLISVIGPGQETVNV